MPEEEHNEEERVQEILPPLDDDPDAIDYRLAREKSLLWRGMEDDERDKVIVAEVVLGQQRRRTLPDWLVIGEGIVLLETEVLRQANANSTSSRRYIDAWRRLAPEQIRQMSQPSRSQAKWLWVNRAAVQTWWASVAPDRRDRWHHPVTIKIQYERDQRIAIIDPPSEADDERPRSRADSTRSRRGAAAAVDEATAEMRGVVDEVREAVSEMQIITGVRTGSLIYDLSSDVLVAESAQNFYEVYGAAYGDERIVQFAEALRDLVTEHEQESFHPRRQRARRTATTGFRRGDDPQHDLEPVEPQAEQDNVVHPRFRRGN